MRTHLAYIVAILVLLVGLVFLFKKSQSAKAEASAYKAAQDSLTVVVNKNGTQTASTTPIQAASENDFKKMNLNMSKELRELQLMVGQLRGSVQAAMIFSSRTEQSMAVPTVRDTAQAVVLYKGSYKDEWIEWNGVASADSFLVHVVVDNEYQYSQVQRNPLFKRPQVTASITNMNPNTRTGKLASFSVDVPKDRFVIGPTITYGIDPFTGSSHTVIGIGGQFNLIGL